MSVAVRSRAEQRRLRTKIRKGDARELALLDATEELLRSGSVQDLTVEAITRRAKLTRTAFYFYFASKEQAVGRLAERYLGEIFEAAQPAFDPEIPLAEGIRAAIENQVEVWGKHGGALAAVADLAGSDPAIRKLWTSEIEAFVEPVRDRITAHQRERGQRPSPHNRVRAEALVWMLERYYYVWASGHYDHPPKAIADTLYEISMAIVEL
jgi:TetR/AcrR family transcriptional regulator, ethionamide resistance regulator